MGALALTFLLRATGCSMFGMSIMAVLLSHSRHNVGFTTRPAIQFVPIIAFDLAPHTRFDPEVSPFTMPALVNGRNVTAPRHGFSRRREDTYAYQHFFHKIRNGTFVEIGAGDGYNGSTSLLFEAFLGWKGLAIEADEAVFERLEANRPATMKLNAPVCSSAAPVHFLQAKEGDGSSGLLEFMPLKNLDTWLLDKDDDYDTTAGAELRVDTVRCVTLEEVFDELQLKRINLLAIDVAGAELSVLKSIDYTKVAMDVVVLTSHMVGRRRDLACTELLESKGYVLEAQLKGSLWFTSRKFRPTRQP